LRTVGPKGTEMMKRLVMVSAACALALGMSAGRAEALALTIGDAYYVGSIDDGVPSSVSLEAGYINYLITLAAGATDTRLPPSTGETYNREESILSGPLPTAVVAGAFKNENPTSTAIDVSGFTYILAKYNATKAGSLVWLIYGAGTTVDLPTSYNDQALGHYTLFNATPVPDGGTTLILLGGALVGLGALRRRFSA
jgi:hypothetical protein